MLNTSGDCTVVSFGLEILFRVVVILCQIPSMWQTILYILASNGEPFSDKIVFLIP